jgi:spoIIIJ-associated protein
VEWVETTGKTVEEAKDRALDQLGVDEHDAEFEVLEEPKVGLFGRLRAEARVRARVRPTKPRPKEERRDKRRRGGKPGGGTSGGAGGGGRQGAQAQVAEASEASEAGAVDGSGEAKAPQQRREQQSRPSRGATAGNGKRGGRDGGRSRDRERDGGDQVNEDVSLAEQGEVARQFLDGLLTEFGASGTVTVNELDEETVEVAVQGGDLGLLIGPKGSTLAALQEITRTVVQRQTGGRNGRLVIDVSGYRQKRREALERFTRQVADEVKASGARKVLEPMSAADRKVVHDTVNDIEGVRTSSEGEEPRRRVVLQPE